MRDYTSLPADIIVSSTLLMETRSIEQAALLIYIQCKMSQNREQKRYFDGKYWMVFDKSQFIRDVLPHLAYGQGRTYHNIINRLIDGGWLLREWHDRNRTNEAPYYTLGEKYAAIDQLGYDNAVELPI